MNHRAWVYIALSSSEIASRSKDSVECHYIPSNGHDGAEGKNMADKDETIELRVSKESPPMSALAVPVFLLKWVWI